MTGLDGYPGSMAAQRRLRAIAARARQPATSPAHAQARGDVLVLLATLDAVLRGHPLGPDGWCGTCLPEQHRPAGPAKPSQRPSYGCLTRILVVENLLRGMVAGHTGHN